MNDSSARHAARGTEREADEGGHVTDPSGRSLAEQHDALLLDLDGTVYLGGRVIDHVAESVARAEELGSRPMYVTNNASRPPAEVAHALAAMGIAATEDAVLTSPQAAAEMLSEAHSAGTVVLVVGAPWLAEAVQLAGLQPVRLAAENPAAVVQGHSPDTGWRELAEACIALRQGADWVACNTDSTLPTDRGLLPGNGAMVAALVAATGLHPRVAGKPERPLLDAAVHRAGSTTPLVVGDRLDTDIEAGVAAGLPSLLVLTGVTSVADLLVAPLHRRPTHVSLDLRGLVEPALAVRVSGDADTRGWRVADGELAAPGGLNGSDPDDGQALAALAALTGAAWSGTTTFTPAGDAAERVLARFGLH